MHSVLALKLGVTEVGIRAVLTIGCKPRVDRTFLRTHSLQNNFQSFSFILVFLLLMLFKLLSYSLLFSNFRWFILDAQPTRALDVSPLVSWHQGMCHLMQSHSPTLHSMFLKRTPSRSWSCYQQEKTLRKLNSYRRTTTMIMRKKKRTTRKKKKATRLKAKMMKTTILWVMSKRKKRIMTPTRSRPSETKPRSPLVD
jgi:hypothetical protein